MKNVNWKAEVEKRKESLIKDTQGLLQIRSVLEEDKAADLAPFGPGIEKALHFMLELGAAQGMQTKNVDGYAAHIELGDGEELIGILGHLDVVPEGDGWTVDPFGGVVRDGKIFARGAIDDKGPTMAAFYGMKIIKELGLPLSKRVRLILGTDEESLWRCVDHYFKHEEMPSSGFAPDADFPIIHAEKGMLNISLKLKSSAVNGEQANMLTAFSSGQRFNMVPDLAEAVIIASDELADRYQRFLDSRQLTGSSSKADGEITLRLHGKSAHGSTPESGVNAGVLLAEFLSGENLDAQGQLYTDFVAEHLRSVSGKELGIQAEDDVSGILTVNPGVFNYSVKTEGSIGLNIRYPVKHSGEIVLGSLEKLAVDKGFSLEVEKHTQPHFVDENHELVQTLKKVYEEQTGQPGKPIAIGGGTYARSLEAGVAFGALFPGREDVAHQKDEYMFLDDLFSAAAIYAQAIYELAK
ncbi:dipeptidase PepV [Fictibacillus sp. NRS-1165]|uniref:dipeptidase PepV n=1 Tax=Fictibacillus sp. NRS-1165 TaxID=3144463 RepID=UPI003D20A94E